jgi:hypothetical protein
VEFLQSADEKIEDLSTLMQGYALDKLLQCLSLLDFQKIMQEFVNFSIKLHDLLADVLIIYRIEWHQAAQLQMEKKYCDP